VGNDPYVDDSEDQPTKASSHNATVEALIAHSDPWTPGAMGYEGLWGMRDANNPENQLGRQKLYGI
jgi:hypothetical protein